MLEEADHPNFLLCLALLWLDALDKAIIPGKEHPGQ